MPQQRSGAVTAIAILHLIGGGLGLILSLCGGIGLLMSAGGGAGAAAGPDPQQYLKDNVPMFMPVKVGQLIVDLILDVMLLSAGIGLLNRQPWARIASIVYGCISIPNKLFTIVYQLAFVNPVINKLFEGNPNLPPGFKAGFQFGQYFALGVSLVFIAYPIAVIWVMLLPSTKRDFELAAGPVRRDDYDDYDDRARDRDDYRDPDREDRGRRLRDDDDDRYR